jgi:hypothetical protein
MKRKIKARIKLNRERDNISYGYLEIKTDLFNPLIPALGKLLLAHTAVTRYVKNHEHVIDKGRIKPETYHHIIPIKPMIYNIKKHTLGMILFSENRTKYSIIINFFLYKPMSNTDLLVWFSLVISEESQAEGG